MNPQETHLQSLLEQLRTRLLVMCARVEEVVAKACAALDGQGIYLAHAVIEADSEIDRLENEVDEMALSLLACSQPVARDLRFVVSTLRMVVDLERVGDEAAHIAERTILLQDSPRPPAFDLMRQMMELARNSLHDAIIAFREENVPLALHVCHCKKDILQMEVCLLQDVMSHFAGNDDAKNDAGWPVLHVILIARSLSRIFGRASNIAEHCYFMKQGVSIKHKKAEGADRLLGSTGLAVPPDRPVSAD